MAHCWPYVNELQCILQLTNQQAYLVVWIHLPHCCVCLPCHLMTCPPCHSTTHLPYHSTTCPLCCSKAPSLALCCWPHLYCCPWLRQPHCLVAPNCSSFFSS